MVGEMLFDETPQLKVKTEPDTPTMTPAEAKVETKADEQKTKAKAKGRKVLTPRSEQRGIGLVGRLRERQSKPRLRGS